MGVLGRGVAALLAGVAGLTVAAPAGSQTLWRSPEFVITDTAVRQGPFVAVAETRDRIVSTYPRAAREVMFKFSLNGLDNEFPPGQDHMIYLRPRGGGLATPVYTFGRLDAPLAPEPVPALTSEEGEARVTFRLDLGPVLESFRTTGGYEPPNGRRIPADSLTGVYVIGNEAPLSWDLSRLRPGSPYELTDPDGDGIYTVTLTFEAEYTRPVDEAGRAVWRRTADLGGLPDYRSDQRLVDALYRLSLEEMRALIREDGGIVGGARWPAVWTRDLAWGTVLAMAPLVPEAVRASLLMKVDTLGRIVQDTGTGGSWPVSTDRVAWALAAWELYAVTGDREWLERAYGIVARTAEADLATAYDPATGLFRGESSFLDWRDQSYPAWMDPKDIYHSVALGTNALHYAGYRALERMAGELGEPSARWAEVADGIRAGLERHLWIPERGYHGQYLYGRSFPSLSSRAEGLGEALVILSGAVEAERARAITARMPVVPFGVPSFWPYIPGVPPYHNAGIWPQVVGFWTWAAAEAGNPAAVEHGLASLIRPAALFLTNKENMVAATGHFEGTELNSDRLVGSVGAMLAAVQRVLLGMRFEPDRLVFEPFVPRPYAGERTLRGLRWRDAVLTVTVRGYGSGVARATLDGRPVPVAAVPADLTGAHTLEIELDGRLPDGSIHQVDHATTPATPAARAVGSGVAAAAPEPPDAPAGVPIDPSNGALPTAEPGTPAVGWSPVPGAVDYRVLRNGRTLLETVDTVAALPPRPMGGLAEVQVQAVDAAGRASFLSEPVRLVDPADVRILQPPGPLADDVAGATGPGYLSLTPARNRVVRLPVRIERPGRYVVDVRYANGSGPINSGSAAGVRTLRVDGQRAGAVVMPHRGRDRWDDWGYSSRVHVRLEAGTRVLELAYTEADLNMTGDVNDVLLDHVRVTRLPDPDHAVESAIDTLLARMTLEEKLGQLTLHVGRWTDVGPRVQERGEEVIRAGRLGTLYGVFGAEYTRELQRVAVEESRLGIPLLFAHDILHGFRTTFPMPLAQAASFDPEAVERAARVAAVEAAAHGLHWTFAPMVDITRDPRWGRVVEGPGEDPYLGSAMAAAQVRGLQGDDLSDPTTVAATAKHFVAYGAAEAGRDYNTVDLSERTLRDVYLPPFRAAVDADVAAVMPAFNEIAGVPMHAHAGLIEGLLRGAWGWEGVVVSDYTGILELVAHGVAATPEDAGILALRSGIDIDIVSDVYLGLEDEVRAGRLDEAVVDTAVRRVLRLKHALGLFEDPYRYSDPEREQRSTLTADHRATARDVARRSIVLLRNDDGVLPLSRSLRRIAVIGPLADDRRATLGSWTGAGRVEHTVSVLEAIRAAAGPAMDVAHVRGLPDAVADDTAGLGEAVEAAAAAEAVVLVLGEPESLSAEAASRATIDLPGRQLDLARAVLATGTPTAVVLMNGRPLALPWLAENAPAIVESWYLGVEHGPAVADVLFGDYNPAGRLPITFPRATGQIPLYYAHRNTGQPPEADNKYSSKYLDVHWTPQFPFGHGLSYTTFEYSDLVVSPVRTGADGEPEVEVSVTVTNTGDRAGDEVVQLYLGDEVFSVTRPVRELRGFRRVHLEPGERTRLRFVLGRRDLEMLDRELRPVVEPGWFRVHVGGSSVGGLEARFEVVDR